MRDLNQDYEDNYLDDIYRNIDAMLRAGKFDEVDVILDKVSPGGMPIVFTLAYLSITSAARDRLKQRGALYWRAKTCLERYEPSRARTLLAGLE